MSISWYVNRLRRMSAQEVLQRLGDQAVKTRLRSQMGKPARLPASGYAFAFVPFDAATLDLDPAAAAAVIAAAERVLAGHLRLFEREMKLPRTEADWYVDPDTGRAAPQEPYSFDIDTRHSEIVGNLTFTPARLIHVTLLASAYLLTKRTEFAELAASQLQLYWRATPFLKGVHWYTGIELGLRLVVYAWTRRLLADWPGVGDVFEHSPLAREQIYRHQQYLGKLRSYGSSANNHLIAELLGLYVGATAFPWFSESARWKETARAELEAEAQRQVFPDGLGRELASEYHGFTMELLVVAAAEAEIGGQKFSRAFYETIARMADAWAATLDVKRRPPRQGDTDDAYVLLLDPPGRLRRAVGLLAQAAALVGASPWWPETPRDLGSAIFKAVSKGRIAAPVPATKRPETRPNLFPQAGLAFLRDLDGRMDELWCRCDHGPHGYLAIAGHAHADALSVEVRHGGVDLLVDPGTYCYLTDPVARRYFRSTIAHNTLEIDGADSATYGGSFLWLDAPKSYAITLEGLDGGNLALWRARHEGYAKHPGHPIHERAVTLDRAGRHYEFEDRVLGEGNFSVRLAFHLGPTVTCEAQGNRIELRWFLDGKLQTGRLILSSALDWESFRGAENPMLGWYSSAFNEREPSTSWIGSGTVAADSILQTVLEIDSAKI